LRRCQVQQYTNPAQQEKRIITSSMQNAVRATS
jgi:hypothetical protein